MTEQWKPIPGWEGYYEVSDRGRVLSVSREVWQIGRWGKGFWRTTKPRILRPGIMRGYERVSLQRNKHVEQVAVHRLVLLAFAGPCPEGMEACHANDERRDNRLGNLRWDTKRANCADRTRNGGSPNANKTHCPQGHPYSPENTYRNGGSRKCRKCHIRRSVERKQRIRAARKAAA